MQSRVEILLKEEKQKGDGWKSDEDCIKVVPRVNLLTGIIRQLHRKEKEETNSLKISSRI